MLLIHACERVSNERKIASENFTKEKSKKSCIPAFISLSLQTLNR